ncbi:hypothetical protein [Kingella oralis]|uniref:hypothetical protein n=2 Tax=Kingella oralis TaxID=505 RepID=UPI0034E4E0DB
MVTTRCGRLGYTSVVRGATRVRANKPECWGSLKPLPNLRTMARWRLADIWANPPYAVCSQLAASRRRSILDFRLPLGCKLREG